MTDKPLRILIALLYYVPHRTGLTLYVQRIAEALASRGHQVTVLTSRYNLDLPRDEQVINGVRVIRLWSPIRISRGMVMPAYPWAAWELVRTHDVISLHTPMLETGLFALYTQLFGKGLVITHHGDLILPEGWLNRIIEWTILQFFKLAAHVARSIIAYSHDYAEHSYYVSPYPSKTHAIYPPIIIPPPERSGVEAMRQEWLSGSPDTARLIGYAGRFVEEKRPDLLIQSLSSIHKKFPGTKIVFAGEYNLRYESFYARHLPLIEKYRKYLVFLGLLKDDSQMANYYAALDVLALPSDTECFALVQVEAMRCGTPVVATNVPGAREVVRVTRMGELVQPGHPQALAEGIIKVLSNRQKYVRSLEEIDSAFNMEETIHRYEKQFLAAYEVTQSSKRKISNG
jgi:glycosyltransferase involved in cell wall biosynthesis